MAGLAGQDLAAIRGAVGTGEESQAIEDTGIETKVDSKVALGRYAWNAPEADAETKEH